MGAIALPVSGEASPNVDSQIIQALLAQQGNPATNPATPSPTGVTAPGSTGWNQTGGASAIPGQALPGNVVPLPPNISYPKANQALLNWLFGSSFDQNGQLMGVPGYPNELNPDLSKTILPQVWSSFNQNKGIDWMKDILGSGGAQNPMDPFLQNVFNQGGMGGLPTEMLNEMAANGRPRGPLGDELSNMILQGRTSGPAGQLMQNIIDTGVAGSSGDMLRAIALGQPNAATNFLQPFLQRPQYNPVQVYQTGRVA